jgi:hypothetical protein
MELLIWLFLQQFNIYDSASATAIKQFISHMMVLKTSLYFKRTRLPLLDSKRFGSALATLANKIALSKEMMEGKATEYSHLDDKHTVFLFDSGNPQVALTAYKSLVLSCFSDEELSDANSDGCYVIGMVHNQNDNNEEHRPRNIHDYWENYDAARASRTPSLKLLVEYSE